MSKLLINEHPLQVLPSLAKLIGLNEALFLQQLHYWLSRSKHEHDGRVWVYHTFEEWQAQFPFWSLRTMQRIAKSLIEKKLLTVRQFKKQDWDRRNWYSIEYANLENLDFPDSVKLSSSVPSDCRLLDDAKLSSSYKDKETTKETNPPPPFQSPHFLAVLEDFETHRKETRHPLKPVGRKQLYEKLESFGEEGAIQAMKDSMCNGWQGVFEPKKGNGTTGPKVPVHKVSGMPLKWT